MEDQLKVLRWEQSEQDGVKGRQWRRSFISGDLEIKGAIIGTDRSEYIPEGKRDRSSDTQVRLYLKRASGRLKRPGIGFARRLLVTCATS